MCLYFGTKQATSSSRNPPPAPVMPIYLLLMHSFSLYFLHFECIELLYFLFSFNISSYPFIPSPTPPPPGQQGRGGCFPMDGGGGGGCNPEISKIPRSVPVLTWCVSSWWFRSSMSGSRRDISSGKSFFFSNYSCCKLQREWGRGFPRKCLKKLDPKN